MRFAASTGSARRSDRCRSKASRRPAVRRQLRAVDSEHRHADQTGVRAERQHVAEQARQRRLMALAKAATAQCSSRPATDIRSGRTLVTMAFNPSEFADDTEYERFALDRLGAHRVRIAKPGLIYHDEANPEGGRRGSMIVKGGTAVMGAQAREELRRSLRPLGFGAAYKILDMLVEHVLRANGVAGPRMGFAKKRNALSTRPATLPVPLDGHPELWDRMAKLYVAFEETRHGITHRRAQVTSSGDLEIYDNSRARIDTITTAEAAAFAAAVHLLAEVIIDVDGDPRRAAIVAWHVNTLASRHGLSQLPAADPEAGRRLLISDVIPLESGIVRFDVVRAHRIVKHQQPPSLWDLELRLGDRVFVGRWEDVPTAAGDHIDFHPASPPGWLSEQVA
jgi:hypothetical protein